MLALLAIPALAQIQPPHALQAEFGAQAALDEAASSLTFIENRGQWDAEARYLARVGGMDAWVTDSGLVFDFYEQIQTEADAPNDPRLDLRGDRNGHLSGDRRGHVVRMQFEGAATATVAGTNPMEGYHNYFLGDDPSRWASYVPLYREVMVSELYKGVGMRLYDDRGLLRYDLLTAPGADLSQVRLRLDGVDELWVTSEGDLAMETSLGKVRQAELLAFQEIDGRQVAVPAAFHVLDLDVVGFKVEPLDPSLPLVIDPLIYSTFLGGNSSDAPRAIAVDDTGNAFVAGFTFSTEFPTTEGAYLTTHPGAWSAFVTKLNPSGSDLVYSTFLGGGEDEWAQSIAVDTAGYVFVAGVTESTNFPTTEGAFQTTFPGGDWSAYVTKLNPSGSELVYSSFLGGGAGDTAQAITVDAAGNAFAAGYTGSTDFPTTDGAYLTAFPGDWSAYVTKVSPSGSDLVYSTYLGGGGSAYAQAIAVDAEGYAFVAGQTESTDFPTTAGAFQTTHPGSSTAFVTKLTPSGSDLVYSTYLGGGGSEVAPAIAVDAEGYAFVVGTSMSTDFPTTAGAFQTTHPGVFSPFVTKLSPSGSDLIYSTFLGGPANDIGEDIALDAAGHAFVLGLTQSQNFPTTEGAYLTTHPGASTAFVTVLDVSVLVSAEPDGRFPARIALESTYPNPFAQSTSIRFTVSEPAGVTLEAFDLLGRRVATIADEPFGPGTHERIFDASALPSGVYIVRMTSGEFSKGRRVVVLR